MHYTPVPSDFIDLVASHQRFYLFSHIDPDGDCIGSSLALGTFLKRLGKEVRYFNPGPFGRREINEFAPLFSSRLGKDDLSRRRESVAIVLDSSTIDRIGDLAEDIGEMTVGVIDHHTSGEPFGHHRFINVNAPSTSLMVQQLIEALGERPNLIESEYIFFGFATDTGFFRHLGENTQASFELVARLVEAGVSPRRMYDQISSGVTLESRLHLGLMLQRVQSLLGGRFLYTWETLEDIRSYGRSNRDSDTLYQQLMKVQGVEILLVLREEEEGLCTGSIRTKDSIDGGKLAAMMGGGGHARAAGFSVHKSIEATLAEIHPLIEQLLSTGT